MQKINQTNLATQHKHNTNTTPTTIQTQYKHNTNTTQTQHKHNTNTTNMQENDNNSNNNRKHNRDDDSSLEQHTKRHQAQPPALTTRPNAFVFLISHLQEEEIAGALVAAFSVKQTHSQHQLVCMVTSSVSSTHQHLLSLLFDAVIVVPSLEYVWKEHSSTSTSTSTSTSNGNNTASFTKWNCMKLTQYHKVLLMSNEMMVYQNIDHLFQLSPPAATFPTQQAQPYEESTSQLTNATNNSNGGEHKYGFAKQFQQIQHGEIVPTDAIELGLHQDSFVALGTLVLLQTSESDFQEFQHMLQQFSSSRYPNCHSSPDEQALVAFYHEHRNLQHKVAWTMIHPKYQMIPWLRTTNDVPFVSHLFGLKPWRHPPNTNDAAEQWWQLARALVNQPAYQSGREHLASSFGLSLTFLQSYDNVSASR